MNTDELVLAAQHLPDGRWSLKQGVVVTKAGVRNGGTRIIGPADHYVGLLTGIHSYRPASTISYWYIKQMTAAGWEEGEMLEREDIP